MVASASVCDAETSAPVVKTDRPIRPVIGARMVVRARSICAVRSAACCAATSARAWAALVCAFSNSCLAIALILTSSP